MITCATKGRAIAYLIEWFRGLSSSELLFFFLTLFISVVASGVSYLIVRKLTEKNIHQLFHDAEIIFYPTFWFTLPIVVFFSTFGLLIILFELIDEYLYFIISDCYLVITILVVSALTKYTQCTVIKSRRVHYISKSWFGRNFEMINNKTIRLEYSYNGFKVYNNKKLYGFISDPGNRPWLKSQKRKYDKFIEEFISSWK